MRLSRKAPKQFSGDRFADAAGMYGDIARSEGVQFTPAGNALTTPTWEEIKRTLVAEQVGELIKLRADAVAPLARIPNVRVMIGVKTNKGSAYLPGVVLPDSVRTGARFGALYADEDVRQADDAAAKSPLSSFQQLLLAKIAAEHQPGTGDHSASGKTNGAEIGHAVVAASISSVTGIHDKVHNLVSGGALSSEISSLGVTDMRLDNGRIRKNAELVLAPSQIAGVLIVREHQVPFPIADDFQVSAGFTLAAQQSRGQAPDLARNLAGMAS